MTRIVLISSVLVFVLGCELNTNVNACVPGNTSPICQTDAFVDGDAHVLLGDGGRDSGRDAFVDADAGPMPDAFMPDAFVDVDGGADSGADVGVSDTGIADSGVDAFTPDAFVPPDAFRPDAGVRRCEDTTSGVCIRFRNVSGDMPIRGWNAQFVWTRVGGSLITMPSDGTSYTASCSTFRTIDADTTECEIVIPDPGMPVLPGVQIYGFPVYPAAIPACTNTGSPACPNFYTGYSMWQNGVSFSTNPSDGFVSIANRPFAAGMLRMIQINLP